MSSMGITSNVTRFTGLSGVGGAGAPGYPVGEITPNVALTIGAGAVRADGLTLMTETIALTVTLDGADAAMTCTIIGPGNTCTLPGTMSVPARSRVGVKVVSSAFAAADLLLIALR